MNAYPGPYSVLVLDNASIHKGQHLLDICNAKGVRVEYLPPYSPDLNPVCSVIINLQQILFIFKMFFIK
jgi:transposase